MNATCPCHIGFSKAELFYDHLLEAHGVTKECAFLLAVCAIADAAVQYSVKADGGVQILGAQLPLDLR